jgi:hypothetical protein
LAIDHKAHEHALDVLRSRLLGVGIGDYGHGWSSGSRWPIGVWKG